MLILDQHFFSSRIHPPSLPSASITDSLSACLPDRSYWGYITTCLLMKKKNQHFMLWTHRINKCYFHSQAICNSDSTQLCMHFQTLWLNQKTLGFSCLWRFRGKGVKGVNCHIVFLLLFLVLWKRLRGREPLNWGRVMASFPRSRTLSRPLLHAPSPPNTNRHAQC